MNTQFAIRVEITEQDSGTWKATEPGGEKDIWGHGQTPHEAVAHYAKLAGGHTDD